MRNIELHVGKCASLCTTVLILASTIEAQGAAPLRDDVPHIADAILSCQFPNGAITGSRAKRKQRHAFVTTYTFSGMALVKAYEVTGEKKYRDAAVRFIDFWMSKQNHTPDRWGLVGTIYDQVENEGKPPRVFVYTEGASKGGPGYDASDSDAVMVAMTAWRCFKVGGDIALLQRHAEGFDLIGQSMRATQQSDGLTWSHPNYKMKYLMDVAEVYAGYSALADIFDALHDAEKSAMYRKYANEARRGIASLWNEEKGYYGWAKDEAGKLQDVDWKTMYPDSAEQIWPVLWGAESPDSPRSKRMWKEFTVHHPHWMDEDLDWPSIGTVAARMGDTADCEKQTRKILEQRLNSDTWEVDQMYFTLLNCIAAENLSSGK
jgi:hypothetical protein